MITWPAVEAALQGRPDWRRIGVEWHGPCPVTLAGRDGAWFGAGSGSGGVRCGCRHCGDAGGRLDGEACGRTWRPWPATRPAPRGPLRAVKRLPRSTGWVEYRTHTLAAGRRGGGPGRGRLARRCRGGRDTGRGPTCTGGARGRVPWRRSGGCPQSRRRGSDFGRGCRTGRPGRCSTASRRRASSGRPRSSARRWRTEREVARTASGAWRSQGRRLAFGGGQAAVSDRIGLRRRPARVRGAGATGAGRPRSCAP